MKCTGFAGYLMAILVGTGFLIGGALTFASGIGKPGIPAVVTSHGVAGGNLPLWIGLILMMMGFAILGGIATVAVGRWEGGDDELPND
jgi:hypothetical protein